MLTARKIPSRNFSPFEVIITFIVLSLERTESSVHVGAQLTFKR